jgi:hypothetical protein
VAQDRGHRRLEASMADVAGDGCLTGRGEVGTRGCLQLPGPVRRARPPQAWLNALPQFHGALSAFLVSKP